MKIKRTVISAMLVAVAMILSYVESLIPAFIFVPGVKLGLANIASVFALLTLGAPSAVCVSLIRIALSSLFFGNAVSAIYSCAGAALSLIAMCVGKKLLHFSAIGISVMGGVSHNIGQIITAAIILGSGGILMYLPVLLISGTVAGMVIGIAGGTVAKRLEKLAKQEYSK